MNKISLKYNVMFMNKKELLKKMNIMNIIMKQRTKKMVLMKIFEPMKEIKLIKKKKIQKNLEQIMRTRDDAIL